MTDETAVFMVVIADVADRAKMADYAKALAASGLYEAHQGYYAAIGKPIDVFEGDWGAGDSVVLAKFPSAAAARAFWDSEAYQTAIKPLRAGAGSFRVGVFPCLPVPDRIEWEG
jgi:uncharacterized protein (DUF1330 family)